MRPISPSAVWWKSTCDPAGTTSRPYGMLPYFIKQGTWYVRVGRRITPVRFWGRHNVLNAAAVWKLLQGILGRG